MKKISIGLIGFGNIGTGVVKLLQQNEKLISGKLGAKLVLKKIADVNISASRGVKISKKILTTNARDIINDPEISIVIELMGGYEPARTFVLEAIKKGKHVVTANKAMLATYGNQIFPAAQKKMSMSVLKQAWEVQFLSSKHLRKPWLPTISIPL